MRYVIDLAKAMTGGGRIIKQPGKRRGKFYFTPSGLLRYGEKPNQWHPVPTLEVTDKVPGDPALVSAHSLLTRASITTVPAALHALMTYWKFAGSQDPKEQARASLLTLHDLGSVVLEPDKEQVAEAPVTTLVVAQPSTTKPGAKKYWNRCEIPNIPEWRPPQSHGLPLLYGGKAKRLHGLPELMLRKFAEAFRRKEKNKTLAKLWSVFCKNFSKDFSDALKRQVDATKINLKPVLKQLDRIKAQEKKRKKQPKVKLYGKTDTHGKQLLDKATLPMATIYTGTSLRKKEFIGRWSSAARQQDCTMNASRRPPGWKGKVKANPYKMGVVEFEFRCGIHRQDPHPNGKQDIVKWSKETLFAQKKREERFGVIRGLIGELKVVRRSYLAGLNDADPKVREIAFAVLLFDTMHARSGSSGSDDVGVLQFTTRHLKRDGSYHFFGKDHVPWDSEHTVKLPYTGKRIKMNRAGDDASHTKGLAAVPGAQRVYDELASGKGPNDPLFGKGIITRINRWLHEITGIEGVHAHNFRHAWGTVYYEREWKKYEGKLKAYKKRKDEAGLKKAFKALMDHCSDVAAFRLGHRRRNVAPTKRKGPGTKFKGSGASTTRGSYLDIGTVLELAKPYGIDPLSNTEYKHNRKLYAKYAKYFPKRVVKAFTSLLELVPDSPTFIKADPTDGELLYPMSCPPFPVWAEGAVQWAKGEEGGEEPHFEQVMKTLKPGFYIVVKAMHYCKRCGKEHQPKCDKCGRTSGQADFRSMHGPCDKCISKAILTKPSEKRERPTKKAKKPIKAGTKANDAKTGTPRYGYPGKGGKAKQQLGPPAQIPQPPPQINVDELANVLQTTMGALKEYAKVFKDSSHFSSYFQQKAGRFLLKHRIGPDKLRRLYEQLRDTHSPRV